MRAACQKYDVPQCNRRRDIIDGGRNHYHFLAGDDLPGRASVEYEATYRGVAETRRGARRMGVPVETGVVVKYVRLSVRFLQFLNLNFASMASTRRDATVTPSTRPSERLRVSRGSRGRVVTASFHAGREVVGQCPGWFSVAFRYGPGLGRDVRGPLSGHAEEACYKVLRARLSWLHARRRGSHGLSLNRYSDRLFAYC